jgi:hypothetical protein
LIYKGPAHCKIDPLSLQIRNHTKIRLLHYITIHEEEDSSEK